MLTYTVGRDCQAIVCDIGSHSTKIGYAGDDHPSAIYGSTGESVTGEIQESIKGCRALGVPPKE